MSYVVQWVMEIVVFLLLAMVIDFLLPSGKMQKYARLTVSLLLILIFLNPLFQLFNMDVNQLIQTQSQVFSEQTMEEEALKKSVEMKKSEIQASQDAYILEQMVVQMKTEAEQTVAEEFHATLLDIEFIFKDDQQDLEQLENLVVTLAEEEKIESINQVEVNLDAPVQNKDKQDDEAITASLAQLWQVEKDKIMIQWEGTHE